jgi:hypothetical protein
MSSLDVVHAVYKVEPDTAMAGAAIVSAHSAVLQTVAWGELNPEPLFVE